ncbi:hypothetical protein D3C87_1414480 [compost metagenome]
MSVETLQNPIEQHEGATPVTDKILEPIVRDDPDEALLVRGMFDRIGKSFAETQAYYELGGMEDAARDKLTATYGHKIAIQLPDNLRTSLNEIDAGVYIDVLEENARPHANEALEEVMKLPLPLDVVTEELLESDSPTSRERYIKSIQAERDEANEALEAARAEIARLKRQVASLQELANTQADMLNTAAVVKTAEIREREEKPQEDIEEGDDDLDVYERQSTRTVAAKLGGTVSSLTIRVATDKQKIAS